MIQIPAIAERCAAVDVGKRGLAAAVAVGPVDKEAEIKTRAYGTTVPALGELRAWLLAEGCTSVAIESTGAYWIPVKNVLEADLRIVLVCPRKHHPKKGEKTDFRDAIDLVIKHRHGLLTGSYVPERGIVELRDLTRRRRKLLGHIASEKNRIQKVLETANVKIGNIVSDVFGVSGQEMLRALLSDDPVTAEQIADMAKRRLRLKIPELTEALKDHQMSEHHRWLIEQSVEHSRARDQQVEAIENRIEEKLKPYLAGYELLLTIPGIKQNVAPAIVAEIGPDMGQFASGDHLCSWAGICPGNNRSAGKSKSSHIKRANKFLLASLVEAAWAAVRTRDSAFQRKFHRWINKLGRKKALIAVARSLLRVIYCVLKEGKPYEEPNAVEMHAREREKQVRHHARRLRQLGADTAEVEQLVAGVLARAPGSIPRPMPDSAPQAAAAHQCPVTVAQPSPPVPEYRPRARGVLGFRIRTAPVNRYSVFKLGMAAGHPRG
jgi:transposase